MIKGSIYGQLKRVLNRSLDVFFLRPFLPFWIRRLNGRGMIYLYHRIENEMSTPFLNKGGSPWTSPEEFRRDIRTLKSFGAEFVRFTEVREGNFSDAFKVVLCADDGFLSCYQTGAKICEDESVPFTIFQCTAMRKGMSLLWEHQLYYLWFHHEHGNEFQLLANQHDWPSEHAQICRQVPPKQIESLASQFMDVYPHLREEANQLVDELYPDDDDIRQFYKSGGEVGSHGHQHLPRSSISQQLFEQELKQSKLELQSLVGRADSYSYPFDDYQANDQAVTSEHYSVIANVAGGFIDQNTSPFAIPRNTFPGSAKNTLRHRRWLLTGSI